MSCCLHIVRGCMSNQATLQRPNTSYCIIFLAYQVGCGTTALSKKEWWDSTITDEEFAKETQLLSTTDMVKIRDKEHLHYYRVFRYALVHALRYMFLLKFST